MTYDPRNQGAQCDRCPLGPGGCMAPKARSRRRPLRADIRAGQTVALVTSAPASDDDRIMSGRAGVELHNQLSAAGTQRRDVAVIPLQSCAYPAGARDSSGAAKRFESRLKQLRKAHAAKLRADDKKLSATEANSAAEEAYPHPISCCRPRFEHDIRGFKNIIALGKVAANTILGGNKSIDSLDGGMHELEIAGIPRKVVPTFSPKLILKRSSLRPSVHATLAKALRWFRGALHWLEPDNLWQPSPAQLREWLASSSDLLIVDTETDGINARKCNLRCLAITDPDRMSEGRLAMPGETPHRLARTVVINILSGGIGGRFYAEDDEAEVAEILREFLTNPAITKAGHNVGYYDYMVFENWLGVKLDPYIDTILLARMMNPAGRKGLKPTARLLTDVGMWEEEKGGLYASDRDRGIYCGNDTTANARIIAPLVEAATNAGGYEELPGWAKPDWWSGPWNLVTVDHWRQGFARRMHKNGIYIDEKLRAERFDFFSRIAEGLQNDLIDMARQYGMTKLNPSSHPQVRDLLYTRMRLGQPPLMDDRRFYTDAGLPGTGAEVIRGHLARPEVTGPQRELLHKLIQFRRIKGKILGTQLSNARPTPDGYVEEDGRVHPSWSAHTTAPGRYACSSPNMQNLSNRKDLGGILRIYRAAPGHVLVGCDLSAAHLVVQANFWKVQRLIDCFLGGGCPHLTLGHDVLGDALFKLDGWGPEGPGIMTKHKPKGGAAKKTREFMKNFRYSSVYWASLETRLEVLRAAEYTSMTPEGVLSTSFPNLGFTLQQIKHTDRRWHEAEPQYRRAWNRSMDEYIANGGHMRSYIFGRRSGDLEGGKPQEVVNFPCISTEQDVMTIAEMRVAESFPYHKWGPGTGVVLQLHDGIYVEVPERLAEWAVEELSRCMTIEVPGCPVPFTCESKAGYTLADL